MIPQFIAEMEGRTYTFQVRVNAYNFTQHHKTFTITRVAKDHGRLPVDELENNVSIPCVVKTRVQMFVDYIAYQK